MVTRWQRKNLLSLINDVGFQVTDMVKAGQPKGKSRAIGRRWKEGIEFLWLCEVCAKKDKRVSSYACQIWGSPARPCPGCSGFEGSLLKWNTTAEHRDAIYDQEERDEREAKRKEKLQGQGQLL